MELTIIQNRIHEIRGYKVMLDFDLAKLYGTTTKRLNEQVKRNFSRFPENFMFQLTEGEWQDMWSQFATTSQKNRKAGVTPRAFTEHGIAMLASVLKSDKAVEMNILIVKAFVSLRQFAIDHRELADQIDKIRQTVAGHSEQLRQIYDVIGKILEGKEEQKKWEERERIGFKKETY
jgi:hypothetical protein